MSEIDYEHTTILELGARGVLDGEPFTLVGRRCIRGNRGAVWNEWTLDSLPHATLAESAGRFTLYREAPLVASVAGLTVGEPLPWLVVERGTAVCVASWGAVSSASEPWEYADLSKMPTGERATISGGVAFVGEPIDPHALGLTVRRGPPALVPAPNVAMPSGIQLWLDIGDTGTLEGTSWHVVGVVARQTDEARWEEYCVYGAGIGLRWLVLGDGSWSFVSPIEAGTMPDPSSIVRLAGEGRAGPDMPRVVWASGELSWAVEIGETVRSMEHGDMVVEFGSNDVSWSRQQPISTDDVARAFNKRALPRPR